MSSYLLNNNGATVIDYTADVVRVKVHGHWVDMTTVGRAPCSTTKFDKGESELE